MRSFLIFVVCESPNSNLVIFRVVVSDGYSFIMNLLVHIPVVVESDVGDFADMAQRNKRPLAYCMAYVAARFVPGCRSIRTLLIPEILSMLKIRFENFEHGDDERWMILQAFAVLYNWASPQETDRNANNGDLDMELRQDALRSSMEMLALRWSVHRSEEEVTALLKQNSADLPRTFAFRKYCYWLWMFTTAHFHSLVSRTPPSIREDATIRFAIQNLQRFAEDKHVRQILPQVGLSLVWSHANLKDHNTTEWWCSISADSEASSILEVLKGLDDALNVWRQTWQHPGQHPRMEFAADPARSLSIDFYQRFTRFCFSTYVNKASQSSGNTEALPVAIADILMQSVERASAFCSLFLDLTPLVKSSIRFAPESTFSMVALACEWVIQAQNLFPSLEYVKPSDLETICGVAELMVDLGVDSKHSARLHGESLLSKLRSRNLAWTPAWNAAQQPQRIDVPWPTPTTSSPMATRNLLDSVATTDGIWTVKSAPTPRPRSVGPSLGLAISSANGSELFPYYNESDSFHYDPSWSM